MSLNDLSVRQMLRRILLLLFWFLIPSACFINTSGVDTWFSRDDSFSYTPSDSEYFYIDLDVDAYDSNDEEVLKYEISTTEEFDDAESRESPSNCEILREPFEEGEERLSSKTKVCILDVPEFEFTLKDLHLVFNVPEGMCASVAVALPWHFNFPIVRGPVVVDGCDDTNTEDKDDLFCDGTCVGASSQTCKKDANDLCASAPGKPKCCVGGERDTGEPWVPELECFGGPGRFVIQGDFNIMRGGKIFHGYTLIPVPEGGLKQKISLEALLSIRDKEGGVFQNLPHANYLKMLEVHPEDLGTITNSSLPEFLRPSAHYLFSPRWFFEVACYDPAGEIAHELLLMIREWNTLEEFDDFYQTGGKDGPDPDVEGQEGDECKYEDRHSFGGSSNICNDWLDLDDITTFPQIDYGQKETTRNSN